MTREEAISNLNMISVAFVDPITKEQRKLINETFEIAIKALEQEKRGYWIMHDRHRECSNCKVWLIKDMPRNSYCPNCGAKMESEVKE